MKKFTDFLHEEMEVLTEASIKKDLPVDISKWKLIDVISAFQNGGYLEPVKDYLRSIHLGFDKKNKQHVFALAMYDHGSDQYIAFKAFIQLASNGIVAEHGDTEIATEVAGEMYKKLKTLKV